MCYSVYIIINMIMNVSSCFYFLQNGMLTGCISDFYYQPVSSPLSSQTSPDTSLFLVSASFCNLSTSFVQFCLSIMNDANSSPCLPDALKIYNIYICIYKHDFVISAYRNFQIFEKKNQQFTLRNNSILRHLTGIVNLLFD